MERTLYAVQLLFWMVPRRHNPLDENIKEMNLTRIAKIIQEEANKIRQGAASDPHKAGTIAMNLGMVANEIREHIKPNEKITKQQRPFRAGKATELKASKMRDAEPEFKAYCERVNKIHRNIVEGGINKFGPVFLESIKKIYSDLDKKGAK